MKKVIEFLTLLRQNNNRDWFEANRPMYEQALGEFNAFAAELIAALGVMDPAVAGLSLKDCTYRIYRDTRFSANKEPYKTHMGAFAAPYGKKSGYAGYYFHIEPAGGEFIGNSLLAVGVYCPEPKVLKSLRDEIIDNGAQVVAAINQAEGFKVEESSKLTRVPKGYPADSPYAEYLKLKDISLYKPVDDDYLLRPGLVDRVVEDFRKTKNFNTLFNRAVSFAKEEM